MEKVFEVPTAAPAMVSLEVSVVPPFVARKNVSAPKTHVKLLIGVKFRTRRWRRHLLHLFSRIGFGTGKANRADCRDTQQAQYQFFHLIFSFFVKSLLNFGTPTCLSVKVNKHIRCSFGCLRV